MGEKERERSRGKTKRETLAHSPERQEVLRVEREVSVSHCLRTRGGQLQLSPVSGELEERGEEGQGQSVAAVVGGVAHED